jgi:very-short-patch-repair endonuclease
MPSIHNRDIFNSRRKKLRENSTPEGNILWHHVRRNNLGCRFYRQHSIGPYIVDFYCAEKKLIIELDGEQYLEHHPYDVARTEYLRDLGFTVIRFWNKDINKNLKGVLEVIVETIVNQN